MVANYPRKGRKAQGKRQTCAQQERQLNSREAIRGMDPELRRQQLKALARQKKLLARIVPSSTWMDNAWDHDAPFPPGGATGTKMVRCRGCERYCPPQNVGSSGHCDDCRLGGMTPGQLAALPPSSSAINIAKAKAAAKAGRLYFGGF